MSDKFNRELEQERRRLAQRLEHDVIASLKLIQAQTQAYSQALSGNPQASMVLSVLSSLLQQTMQVHVIYRAIYIRRFWKH